MFVLAAKLGTDKVLHETCRVDGNCTGGHADFFADILNLPLHFRALLIMDTILGIGGGQHSAVRGEACGKDLGPGQVFRMTQTSV